MNSRLARNRVRVPIMMGVVAAVMVSTVSMAAEQMVVVPAGQTVYEPDRLRIAPGDTVTWTHRGTILDDNHPTVCDENLSNVDCPWGQFTLKPGERHSVTFPDEGTIEYFCSLHAGMTGTIVVGSGEPAPPPSPGSQEPPPASPTESAAPPAPPAPPSSEPGSDNEPTSGQNGSDQPGETPEPTPGSTPEQTPEQAPEQTPGQAGVEPGTEDPVAGAAPTATSGATAAPGDPVSSTDDRPDDGARGWLVVLSVGLIATVGVAGLWALRRFPSGFNTR